MAKKKKRAAARKGAKKAVAAHHAAAEKTLPKRKKNARRNSAPAIEVSGRSKTCDVQDLLYKVAKNYYVIPHFQRRLCWTDEMKIAYVQRCLTYNFFQGNVIVFELIDAPGVIYVEDGRQRLNALCEVVDPEGALREHFSPEDVEKLKRIEVSVHHYVHADIESAIDHFVEVNKRGMPLSSSELFCAYMSEDNEGKEVYNNIQKYVGNVDAQFLITGEKQSAAQRNAIALFELYATSKVNNIPSRDGVLEFFTPVNLKKVENLDRLKHKQTEYRVRHLLRKMKKNEIALLLTQFEAYLAALSATIRRRLTVFAAGDENLLSRKWDITALRGLLMTGLFVSKHPHLVREDFDAVVDWYLKTFPGSDRWRCRLVDTRTGAIGAVLRPEFRVAAGNMNHLTTMPAWGGPDLPAIAATRRAALRRHKRTSTKGGAGFDASHEYPAADGGTVTHLEPSIKNRARGRAPMTPEDVQECRGFLKK